jgi:hypothetical protein
MILNTSIWKNTVTAAKAKVANQPAWLRAIERAVAEIERSRYWSFADGVLTIESTTSRKLYKVDAAHTCEARGGICKHKAARRLMTLYVAALAAAPPPSPMLSDSTAQAAPVAMTTAQRQAERDAAILVKPSQRMKRVTYNGMDI